MSSIPSVWFWLPFHMLQAYPNCRMLPLPDLLIPFAHLIWVPAYLWEHWAGECDAVAGAWAMKSWIIPIQGVMNIAFFYITYKKSNYKPAVLVFTVLYFGFMFTASSLFGYGGSPKPEYEDQILANADPAWLDEHVVLHVWYLLCLYGAMFTVPMKQLGAIRAGIDLPPSTAPQFFEALAKTYKPPPGELAADVSLLEVFVKFITGKK